MSKLVLSLAILFMAFVANAQKVKVGIKGGANIANINGNDEVFDLAPRTLYHAGVFAEFIINEKFSLQPELIYSRQGWSDEINIVADITTPTIGTLEIDFNYNYLNVPVLVQFYPVKGFSLFTGPQLGIFLNGTIERRVEIKVEGYEDYEQDPEKTDLEGANPVDFGWVFGTAYRLPFGLGVDARYNYGVTSVDKGRGDFDKIPKNSVFQLGVSYQF